MPTRPSLQFGKSVSSPQSTDLVNGVASAVQKKLVISQTEELPSTKSSRRTSFRMNAILHPGKDKDHQKRSDSKDREARKAKRNSLTGGLRSSSRSKDALAHQSPRLAATAPGNLDMIIESPPLVFYGNTQNSTGALLSGRLRLNVTDPAGEVNLTKLVMVLNAAIHTKKPVAKDCPECATRVNDLKTWNFLSESKTFSAGTDNQFPFSFLLPGHLPATTVSCLGSVTYHLEAEAITSNSEKFHFTHPLGIQRAVPPGLEKSSVRIFPPTNLTSRLVMPPTIHPIGVFPLQMTLSGVVDKKTDTQTRWRLRKLMWRIDEHTKMISPPCSRHGHKVGGDGKALQHQDERTVGSGELKSGWKTDFDTQDGDISLEFEASLCTSKHPICDMDSPAGLEVKHNLVIELIIAEEFCPNRNTSLITPTGSARVLRMQFGINVTERAGMGISWDEEMPPVYDDVPASPPGYGGSDRNHGGAFSGGMMEDYDGPEIEPVDLERMQTDNANDPPMYRERDPAEYAGILESMMRRPMAAGTPSPAPGPSSTSPTSVARRTSSSNYSIGQHRTIHHRLTEDDFGIEPPELWMRAQREEAEAASQSGPAVEDVGEGERAG